MRTTSADLTLAPSANRTPFLTYEPYYGLKEKAFSLSADPRFLYKSRIHGPAFDELRAGIRRREGLIVLTGEPGTGKTTLCRSVLKALDRKTFCTIVPDPFVSREDLLKILLLDFGVVSVEELKGGRLNAASRPELSYPLYEFLKSLVPLQAYAVLIIDEAQNLSSQLLEEIRILADLEGPEKLLQLVLVGQPELARQAERFVDAAGRSAYFRTVLAAAARARRHSGLHRAPHRCRGRRVRQRRVPARCHFADARCLERVPEVDQPDCRQGFVSGASRKNLDHQCVDRRIGPARAWSGAAGHHAERFRSELPRGIDGSSSDGCRAARGMRLCSRSNRKCPASRQTPSTKGSSKRRQLCRPSRRVSGIRCSGSSRLGLSSERCSRRCCSLRCGGSRSPRRCLSSLRRPLPNIAPLPQWRRSCRSPICFRLRRPASVPIGVPGYTSRLPSASARSPRSWRRRST